MRIKINTTFEEDEIERRQYFAGLSYSDRLRHYFKLRKLLNFNGQLDVKKVKILKVYHSHNDA